MTNRMAKKNWKATPTITINTAKASNTNTREEHLNINIIENNSKKAGCLAVKLDKIREKTGRSTNHI